jgi:hypothetical protein
MRTQTFKRSCRSSSVPVYTFDTDVDIERVIRDPMAVLLGRASRSPQRDATNTDPYNRVGRWARAR